MILFYVLGNGVSQVHATDYELDFLAIPQGVADRLGVPLIAGQLIAWSFFYLIMVSFTYAIRRKFGFIGLTISVVWLCVGVVITWMPLYVLIIMCFLMALMYSSKIKRWLS